MRCRGKARAGLLARGRIPHQIMLLASLPIVHRKQAHTRLIQPQSSQGELRHRPGLTRRLEKDSDAPVASSGTSKNI